MTFPFITFIYVSEDNYSNSINKVSPTDDKNYYDESDSSVEAVEVFEPKDIDDMKTKYEMLLKMLEVMHYVSQVLI